MISVELEKPEREKIDYLIGRVSICTHPFKQLLKMALFRAMFFFSLKCTLRVMGSLTPNRS